MVFSSVEFLFLFLPLTLLSYWVSPQRLRNGILLAASLVFYAWGAGTFVLLLGVSIVVDYVAGLIVTRALAESNHWMRRLGVTLSVVVNLGLLAYFKYANFLVDQINQVAREAGLGTIAWTSIVLPIGISFFTFQSMSYTIDIATGRARRLRSLVDFALYVTLFPQLIAGPIVRYHEIADEISERRTDLTDIAAGAVRFSHGLVKKIVVADAAAAIADTAFGLEANGVGFATAWIGIVAYSVQIYFDFSGYSDMAIGLGRMVGFTFPENFNRPYSALSITDFWRRWHITLSNWFRDYLYVPIGGSKGSSTATYRNLTIVFLLTGMWHGANWTFIVWGAYHGAWLILERAFKQRTLQPDRLWPVRRLVTLIGVMVGWAIFRAESLTHAVSYISAMFSMPSFAVHPLLTTSITHRNAAIVAIAFVTVIVIPRDFVTGVELSVLRPGMRRVGRAALLTVGIPYAFILTTSGSFSPFLYFQF